MFAGCGLQHAAVHDDDGGGPGGVAVRPRGAAGRVLHPARRQQPRPRLQPVPAQARAGHPLVTPARHHPLSTQQPPTSSHPSQAINSHSSHPCS